MVPRCRFGLEGGGVLLKEYLQDMGKSAIVRMAIVLRINFISIWI